MSGFLRGKRRLILKFRALLPKSLLSAAQLKTRVLETITARVPYGKYRCEQWLLLHKCK